MYEIVKNYRTNDALRRSFNALAEKTFGLNFENWYQNGFWGDNYNPYSVVIDGQVVANVSLNRTDMVIDGKRRKLLQLGTVMTDESFRNRGYIRAIMQQIDKDYPDTHGVYLFANDSVVDFYPKFGFRKSHEYEYSKTVCDTGECRMEQIIMDTPEKWALLGQAMEDHQFHCGCHMVDNPGLIFFYVSQFMQECAYYCNELDTWVIAELEEDALLIHNVFAKEPVDLDDVVEAFGSGISRVTLGFTPSETSGWTKSLIGQDDCTFFVKGHAFDDFEDKSLRIPSLSHA